MCQPTAHDRIAAELDRRIAEAKKTLPPGGDRPSPAVEEQRQRRERRARCLIKFLVTWWAATLAAYLAAVVAEANLPGFGGLLANPPGGVVTIAAMAGCFLSCPLSALAAAPVALWYCSVLPWRWIILGLIPVPVSLLVVAVLFVAANF